MSVPVNEGLTLGAVSAIVERKVLTDTVRIYRPGDLVFNPETGQYEPGPPVTVHEGSGAVFSSGGPGIVLNLEGQAYVDDTTSRYRLLTPLAAAVASRGDFVTVLASQDAGMVGRIWKAMDLGDTNTLSVVRTTWLDQQTQTTGG
ncbi:DUF6093 family protein [Streptomyces sp. NBC_01262]|uniref:DUF6093 family protein n=1 Tax=Streptomyces sp. NBC_01262 TaxID=2903803 RepID=UPI002E337594|nr:DUF6093 family protein [Streptomyces sp. NBC_01262]